MATAGLKQVLTSEIQDLASAEDQVIASLPSLIERAGDPELKQALEQHLATTKAQRNVLGKVARDLEIELDGGTSDAMTGILSTTRSTVDRLMEPGARDAAIIASAQRVEHYEMAGYGSAAHFARALGENVASEQLKAILKETKDADARLTRIADDRVNERAANLH